jgi:hypothetical protein
LLNFIYAPCPLTLTFLLFIFIIFNKIITLFTYTLFTIKGEIGVANFLVNFFNDRGVDCGFAGHTCSWEVLKGAMPNKDRTGFSASHCASLALVQRCGAWAIPSSLLPSPLESALRASHDHGAATGCCTAYSDQNSTTVTEGFETKLVASEASCTMRSVQRICLERQASELPTQAAWPTYMGATPLYYGIPQALYANFSFFHHHCSTINTICS